MPKRKERAGTGSAMGGRKEKRRMGLSRER
jgi:hypothetical protein